MSTCERDPLLPTKVTAGQLDPEKAETHNVARLDAMLRDTRSPRVAHMIERVSVQVNGTTISDEQTSLPPSGRVGQAQELLETILEEQNPPDSKQNRQAETVFAAAGIDVPEKREQDTPTQLQETTTKRFVGWFYRVILCSYIVVVAVPLFVTAGILYYYCGNPVFDFMAPVTLSWACKFAGRQVILLELARLLQWLVLDCLFLGSQRIRLAQLFGPFVTIFALKSRGWPFTVAAWAAGNLILLYGHNRNWFYWTGWEIDTVANSGNFILSSPLYLHIFLALFVAGLATSMKRMLFALKFGRRMIAMFKRRMEKLTADIVLLRDISDLAEGAEQVAELLLRDGEPTRKMASVDYKKKWPNVKFEGLSLEDEGEEADAASVQPNLDRWVEPETSFEKSEDATMQDVLKFRYVLSLIHDKNPFGVSFGPAADRNQHLESSHALYRRLLKCNPGSDVLSFDTLALVATEADGTQDLFRLKALQKLFRPDVRNELPLPAFVQSCDNLYKRLLYMKASVKNASVIDDALENIFNILYWFALFLILLLMMNFNPWPWIVSITSLLVSLSFALGSSMSKYVEGVLLIAVRRPFDLGDRVIIGGAAEVDCPNPVLSWFVEDISLYSTKLRFARTNQVSTVNNYSISESKIVNLQRSPSAIVYLRVFTYFDILKDGKFEQFRSELEKYVSDRPRIWDSLDFCRHDEIDASVKRAQLSLAFRHRASWQNAAGILVDRANLVRFIHEMSETMGIDYGFENSPPDQRLVFQGGAYES